MRIFLTIPLSDFEYGGLSVVLSRGSSRNIKVHPVLSWPAEVRRGWDSSRLSFFGEALDRFW